MNTDANQPAGLLLAAGGGSRFGRPKALIDFHGEPLVQRGVRLLRRGGCRDVTVVTGAAGERVRGLLGADVRVVDNPRWHSGMASSLCAGIDALCDAPAVVVALVDHPLVGPTAIGRLVARWLRGALVAVATYDGAARHPMLFDARTYAAVRDSASGDRGARTLLRQRPEWVQPVACDDVASPRDIDTAADLHALLAEPDPNPQSPVTAISQRSRHGTDPHVHRPPWHR